jgi:DNA-binding NarL/FixJ family response regulator
MHEPPYGILLCDDLIFVSRITGTAKALDLRLRSVKTPSDLLQFVKQSVPRCVIVDLHTPGLSLEELVRELSAMQPKPLLVGYGSHVDTVTLKNARTAGCDIVWPRSKFVDELPTALPSWFQQAETTS